MTIKDCFSKLPKVKAKDRILLLTHNDLDAGGSTIVAKCVFPSIEVMHCSNNNMSWNIRSTILDKLPGTQADRGSLRYFLQG